MSKFKAYEPVRVEKPGWEFHGKHGRFIENTDIDGIAWVAFRKDKKDRSTAPPEEDCRNSKKTIHQRVSVSTLRSA